ncbi:hypothetical protein I302_108907 [Kwoniella bestiolae CBS 10118]|uniref:Uncharacterized protein n=1 Tax=Kwoniella bestiolae CBS 10118 TaxID=1296100 RepID=A0A1B9FUF5_9TREE|nr:hypothetical protein I302_08045 [Kwoniella bestiolae CBS 10118]OCF22397.1 hypothetical protein I302_08045 [Kwoniella bestiolae CBS 10118]
MAAPRQLIPREDDQYVVPLTAPLQADSSQHEQSADDYLQTVANLPGIWDYWSTAAPFTNPLTHGGMTVHASTADPFATTTSYRTRPDLSSPGYLFMSVYPSVVGSGRVDETDLQGYIPQRDFSTTAESAAMPRQQLSREHGIDEEVEAYPVGINSLKRRAATEDTFFPRKDPKLSFPQNGLTELSPQAQPPSAQPYFNHDPTIDPSITNPFWAQFDLEGPWWSTTVSIPSGIMPGPTSSYSECQISREQNVDGKRVVLGASLRFFLNSKAKNLGSSGTNNRCQLSREGQSDTFTFTKYGKPYDEIAAPIQNGSRSTEGYYKGDWSSRLSVTVPDYSNDTIDVQSITFRDLRATSTPRDTSRAAMLHNLFCVSNPVRASDGTGRYEFETAQGEYEVHIPCEAKVARPKRELDAVFSIMLKTTLAE